VARRRGWKVCEPGIYRRRDEKRGGWLYLLESAEWCEARGLPPTLGNRLMALGLFRGWCEARGKIQAGDVPEGEWN
jgi:hypothetical protein